MESKRRDLKVNNEQSKHLLERIKHNIENTTRKIYQVIDGNKQLQYLIEQSEKRIQQLENENAELDKDLDRFLTSNHEVVLKLNARKRNPIKLEDLYVKNLEKERVYNIGCTPPPMHMPPYDEAPLASLNYDSATKPRFLDDRFNDNDRYLTPLNNKNYPKQEQNGSFFPHKSNIIVSPQNIKKVSFENEGEG